MYRTTLYLIGYYGNASHYYVCTYIASLVIVVQVKHFQVKLIFMILELHGGSFRQLNASKQGQTYPLVPKKESQIRNRLQVPSYFVSTL
jgi:hypothetical protein